MDFFGTLKLSQYTFRSFYLMLFKEELPNDKKIKIIKNDKNMTGLVINEKHFQKNRYSLIVIMNLFEKINSEGCDTAFMTKIQLIEYNYTIFIELFKNTLEKYLKADIEKKKKLKPMINNIFSYKDTNANLYGFYNAIINNIIVNFNFKGCCNNELNYDYIKDYLDNKLLIQVQSDITEFINKTILELKDPFYFALLAEIYFKNNLNNDFIINVVKMILDLIIKKMDNKNNTTEINSKNVLILLYKIIFFINKRHLILYTENKNFLKTVIVFLFKFIESCNILYTKILFPIETSRCKLLIEIVFEIIFELHFEYIRNPKIKELEISTTLLKSLFNENTIKSNLSGDFKHKKHSKNKSDEETEIYSPFYIMDKISFFTLNNNNKEKVKISDEISISKKFYILKDYIITKYKDEINESKDLFSVCMIFSIKLILSMKEIEEFYLNFNRKKSNISKNLEINCETTPKNEENINNNKENEISKDDFMIELKKQFINLCKNIINIHHNHTSLNPFKSIGFYAKDLYEYFRSFIVDKLSFFNNDPDNKIEELKKNLNHYKNEIKIFARVIYTDEGRIRQYSEIMYNRIIEKVKSDLKDNESIDSFNKMSSEGRNSLLSNSLRGSIIANNSRDIYSRSVQSTKKIGVILNVDDFKPETNTVNNKINLNESTTIHNEKYIYINTIKFRKDLLRTYFSSYFRKLLTYDEDFINIKHLYTFTYYKEIKDIDKYGILYPTRLKNYITNNYSKMFLKRDFDFFTDGYFKYTHGYVYNKKLKYNYDFQNKLLFPNKKLVEENDCAHKGIESILKNLDIYECEMLTVKGSIFGNIYVFENCLLFQSELKKDKRELKSNEKEEYSLDYAFCTMEYDHLLQEKKIIIEFDNIKEVVNRTFFYSWISFEIFQKDGKSFLFNLFMEDTNTDMLEYLQRKKIPVIRETNEYFRKAEFAKKWKEEKIKTYDYLLLLNKLSSRTYNDPNQYPIMPWPFLEEGIDVIRDFNLPISVQGEVEQKNFLSKIVNFDMDDDDSACHGNHYSTSAYICFYLMRANPFTNNMIKFQSKSFDVPDRQYCDIQQTICLCQKGNNNREMIPELFSIPEIYLNLNDNDFGKRKDGIRVHNITFKPYAKNAIEFCYTLNNLINNNNKINNEINQWFDFIFGVNQRGNKNNKNANLNNNEKEKFTILRRFNSSCYGQLNNINIIISEAKRNNKSSKDLFNDIKDNINLATNFGQCPFQLLNEVHPSKNKSYSISDNCCESSTPNNNINSEESNNNQKNDNILNNKATPNNNTINKKIEDIYKIRGSGEILFFGKSSKSNYLYCLLSSSVFEIYKYNSISLQKLIMPKIQFLYNKNLIFRIKYTFCELDKNSYLFCHTLDKTLQYYNYSDDKFTSFVLKLYTTCIININNKEFITGHDNGSIGKWVINYSNKDKKVELELLSLIKSNNKSIACLIYNKILNIIISCDYNTIMIRKVHDFEYLNSIDIKNDENYKKLIVDVKISDYNFLYALIYIEEKDIYELQGYTMNGTYFGVYSGKISNFQITKTGKIIVGEINRPIIKILDPVNLTEIFEQKMDVKGENIYFDFYFERPNLIYYGIRDNDSTRIKMIFLDEDEEKKFL